MCGPRAAGARALGAAPGAGRAGGEEAAAFARVGAASGEAPVTVVTGEDVRSSNAAALMPRILRQAAEMRELLRVSGDEALLLLAFCGMDKERLQERYFDYTAPLRLATDVGARPSSPLPRPATSSGGPGSFLES